MLHPERIDNGIELMVFNVDFLGALLEYGIAVIVVTKGKTDIAPGNILRGILQMTLLVFGTFASVFAAPIDDFM